MNKENVVGYYQVSAKENSYFALRVVFSLLIYCGIALLLFYADDTVIKKSMSPIIIGVSYFAIFYLVFNGFIVGMIKANSVKLSGKQLPEVFDIVNKLSRSLKLKSVPNTYLLQSGGSLNAFAKKFMGSNYVVIYSELLEAYYEGNVDALEFVVAHELGHIKRTHFLKSLLLFPSAIIPFLAPAYNRACEITCDNIGKFFNPKGAIDGLLILAGGRRLAREINVEAYLEQQYADTGFWRWFFEKTAMNHPPLFKRLANVYDHRFISLTHSATKPKPDKKDDAIPPMDNKPVIAAEQKNPAADYSKYMPQ